MQEDEQLSRWMKEFAEQEGRRYMAENERLQNDPAAAVPLAFEQKALDIIDRYMNGDHNMDEYKAPYLLLFNRVSDAVKQLDEQNYGAAKALLLDAQHEAEALFIEEAE